MPRIRSVKPEFFSSEPVGNCSPTSRLLFVALWCFADDDGRCVDNPRVIRAFAFPLDDAILSTHVEDMLTELHAARLLVRYEHEGRKYIAISNFREHQHPKKRLDSKLPPPPVPHQFPTSSPPVVPVVVVGVVEGEGVGSNNKQLPAVADAPPAALSLVPEPGSVRTPRPAPKYPHFPKAVCDAMYALWTQRMGGIRYEQFRGLFGPLFSAPESERPPEAPNNAQLIEALKSYVDLAPMGSGAPYATAGKCAGVLAAIAIARRDFADNPEARLNAVQRIIHGRMSA